MTRAAHIIRKNENIFTEEGCEILRDREGIEAVMPQECGECNIFQECRRYSALFTGGPMSINIC